LLPGGDTFGGLVLPGRGLIVSARCRGAAFPVEDPNLIESAGHLREDAPLVEGIVIGRDTADGETAQTLQAWRERALQAEKRVAELAEQVAVLSRILFGQSSERSHTGKAGAGGGGPDAGSGADSSDGR
jgi:hypothetical protein